MRDRLVAAHVIAGIALLGLLILFSAVGVAHEAGQPYADFFSNLKQPGNGASCCNTQDCSETEYRLVGDHYEAWIEAKQQWMAIPAGKILQKTHNPTGNAVVCYHEALGILCFLLPSLT